MRNPFLSGPFRMPGPGGEGQGGNTVFTGGPGSSFRAPLYVKIPLAGSGGQFEYIPIASAAGNIQQPFFRDFVQGDATIPASQTLMIAPVAMQLIAASCRFSHAGGALAALSLAKDPSGTAPGSGTGLVTATADLTGGAVAVNVNQPFSLSATVANLQFAAGDGFSWIFSGTLTALTGLVLSTQWILIP